MRTVDRPPSPQSTPAQPPSAGTHERARAFDHAKLDVYPRSLQVLGGFDQILTHLTRGQGNARTQSDKASTSVLADTAEGAGEFNPPETARFYRIARRSGIELAARLDIDEQPQHALKDLGNDALTRLERVVWRLVRLIQNCDRRREQRQGG